MKHFTEVRDGVCAPYFLQAARSNATQTNATQSGASRLDEKIRQTRTLYNACDVCPHDCHVDRNNGKVGFCGVAAQSAVHWEGILYGEEIELVPSHEVFFSGCTMRCAFCYSHQHIMRPMSGVIQSPVQLAEAARTRFSQGATNWNLVGGDPTVHLLTILQTLRELAKTQTPLPVVWNSNMYIAAHAMEILDGVVDLYLGDIHFGNNDCAQNLGRIPRYFETVTTALQMAAQSGASLVIRHLVMPGHGECCARPAMEWAKQALPEIPFHLMFQYVPDFRARGDAVLGRPLSPHEIQAAQSMAEEIGVNLYRKTDDTRKRQSITTNAIRHAITTTHEVQLQSMESEFMESQFTESQSIGDWVDVLIYDDGRVVFTRLTDDLLPIVTTLTEDSTPTSEKL